MLYFFPYNIVVSSRLSRFIVVSVYFTLMLAEKLEES
jgi:hypothetical protein